MSLCDEAKAAGKGKYHRWDAQKALAKGGVEDGDPCDCGEVRFGMNNSPLTPFGEAVVRLLTAAEHRLARGHNDTCSSMLSDYPCSCGHDHLQRAVDDEGFTRSMPK